ncbi:hypothetical protein L1049_017204 [Liquidambar formosana]|uniref:CG-1 domain-containing protein n=1 Tax=Liquidambar formosana TaxID=63359 RepID=A0AAP0S7H5_LIQFO
MERSATGGLAGSEIHGFRTMEDLDVKTIMVEAQTRWLRPNEIHAMLSNYNYFPISVKPVNLPKSGTIVWFDRKMLRNFRKDGHNWKKKKDGKTVKEAHEHLKVGNDERIHVYYAHGQDNPTFVRRCYWLLDKYAIRLQGSPVTPVTSNSSSGLSDPSASLLLSEETDSGADRAYYASEKEHLEASGFGDLTEPGSNSTIKNYERRLHEINTLEWEELLVTNDPNNSIAPKEDEIVGFQQQNHYPTKGFKDGGQLNLDVQRKDSVPVGTGDSLDILVKDGLQTQDSFGRWMNSIMIDSPGSVDDPSFESSVSSGHDSFVSPVMDHQQSSVPEQIFSITDVSPPWAFSSEKTKILVIGFFHDHAHLAKSNLFCVCGDVCAPAEFVQVGVFRCLVSPHSPGLVNIYLSFDGRKPISQVLSFEYRTPLLYDPVPSEYKSQLEQFQFQMRLAHLLFSTSKSINILSSKVSQNVLKEAKKYADKTSNIASSWSHLIKSIGDNKISFPQAKDRFFELVLKNKLQEWLLEKVVEGRRSTERDDQGRGVIHLCAILGYTWAVQLFSLSGLSLDYRDKFGWTALHWAAYCGREKMVAILLSAGAKPNLVTDPTPENPGGYTASDLASMKGYDGLAAYLAEKALVEHFKDMTIAGNVSGSLQMGTAENLGNIENLSEEELYLKDTLTAYRTAADAAARIQAAFRENSLKLRTKAVQSSNPETEARAIIAALKIQHAFRNYDTRKKITAAARIQHRFRSWKIRRDFLNMRRQAIKIQAVFRGYQVRRQYRKIIWSVGVLEKAILRWRFKRRGFRGLQVDPVQAVTNQNQESDIEEEFFRASRKQAEERIERSVVKVQAMFRSKQAQQEYRRMKLAHTEAQLEYEGLLDPDINMDR